MTKAGIQRGVRHQGSPRGSARLRAASPQPCGSSCGLCVLADCEQAGGDRCEPGVGDWRANQVG